MPYTLKQLELRRDSCIKKIQELKASAEDKGAAEFGNLNFNAVGFFHDLLKMPSQNIDLFLKLFPQFPEILECSRQAANAEKRRSFEEKIAKIKMEQVKKFKRLIEDEEKKERKKRKSLRMLTGATGSVEGTSKTMN